MQNKSGSQLDDKFVNQAYIRGAVEEELDRFLGRQSTRAEAIGADYGQLMQRIRTLVGRGGKRLRPTLAAWSYAGFGGTDEPAIIQAAAAVELFHAGILMHDDIIDRDTVRWGNTNITGRYLQDFETQFTPVRARSLADSMALLAGDSCITLAYQLLLTADFSQARRISAQQLMYDMFFEMLGGELLDITTSLEPLNQLNPDALQAVSRYKTASYSFVFPLELGALLAGAPLAQRQKLRAAGEALGIAYQLQDDILGIFGDETKTGKPILSDVREGKRTLLIHLAYQQTDERGRQLLRKWLGSSDTDMAALEAVRTIVRSSGALTKTKRTVAEQYGAARKTLDDMQWRAPYGDCIAAMYTKLLSRDS